MTDTRELRGRLDELKYVAGELRPALDALLNEPEPERVRAAIVARVCGMLEDAATAERQRCAAALERLEALEAALRKAEQFIVNGVEFGYIRMPDADTPDPAHETLPASALVAGGEHGSTLRVGARGDTP